MKSDNSQENKTEFNLYAPHARTVILVGSFNDWNAIRMLRRGNGEWRTEMRLAPGQYEYQFMVDGQWLNDPNASESIQSLSGRMVSIRVV